MTEVDLAVLDESGEKVIFTDPGLINRCFSDKEIFTLRYISQAEIRSYMPAVMQITHPAGCFSQFLNYFGEKVGTSSENALHLNGTI